MAKTIKIGGRLESVETGNIVAVANQIIDDDKNKRQSVINGEVDAELVRLDETKQGNLTFDNAPTEDSNNPVKSGGVYAADKLLSDAIEAILLLIPSAASALNKLVDMQTMNSSIATATATFRGTYNVVSDLELAYNATHEQIAAKLAVVITSADNNDYAFVQIPVSATSQDIAKTERYKFNGEAWAYEYDLNNSGFTQAQWDAINSTITAALVSKLSALPTATELQTALNGKQDNLTFDLAPTSGSQNPVTSGGIYARNAEIVSLITALDTAKQDKLTFDSTPTQNSSNPVTSNGVYVAVSALQAAIVALDAAKQNVLTFDSTPTLGSNNPVTSSGIKTELNRIDGNITTLNNLYEALTQSDIVVVEGALPSTGQQQNVIYRQPDPDHTPPQFYSDYMWNGTAWVLMATYNNAIDDVPTVGSNNLVKSGGVASDINKKMLTINGYISLFKNKYISTPVGNTVQFSDYPGRCQTELLERKSDDNLNIIDIKGATPSIFVWVDANFEVVKRENASLQTTWYSPAKYLSIGFNDSENVGGYDKLQVLFNWSLQSTVLDGLIKDGWKFCGVIGAASSPRNVSGHELQVYLAIESGTYTNFRDSNNNPIELTNPDYIYIIRNAATNGVANNYYFYDQIPIFNRQGVYDAFAYKAGTNYVFVSKIVRTSEPKTPDAKNFRLLYLPTEYGIYNNFVDYSTGNPIEIYQDELSIIREVFTSGEFVGYIKDVIGHTDCASALYGYYRVCNNYRLLSSFTLTSDMEITSSSDTAVILPYIENGDRVINVSLDGTNIRFNARVVSFDNTVSTLTNIESIDCSLYKKVGLIVRTSGTGSTVLTEEQIKRLKVVPQEFEQDIETAVYNWLNAHPEATTTVQDGSITNSKLATELAYKDENTRIDNPRREPGQTLMPCCTYFGAENAPNCVQDRNVLFGTQNLFLATTANRNVAVGFHSQYRQMDGIGNVSVGTESQDNISHGDFNTSLGSDALRVQKKSFEDYGGIYGEGEDISDNTVVGGESMYWLTGSGNTTLGRSALKGSGYNQSGSHNMAIGAHAGEHHTSGDNDFYLDNLSRSNNSDEKTKGLLSGKFDAVPSNQQFRINAGLIVMPYLPTSDPQVQGALWNDNGILKISSGS